MGVAQAQAYNTVFVGSYASPNFASQNFTNTGDGKRFARLRRTHPNSLTPRTLPDMLLLKEQ